VRLALKVVMKKDGDFMDVILLSIKPDRKCFCGFITILRITTAQPPTGESMEYGDCNSLMDVTVERLERLVSKSTARDSGSLQLPSLSGLRN